MPKALATITVGKIAKPSRPSVGFTALLKPTIKKYLYSYVQTGFLRINADEAATAIYLPVQRFKKASIGQVYADSRRFI